MQEFRYRYSNLLFILAWFCILLSWLVSNHYFPWATFYNDFLAAVSIWLLLLGITIRNTGFDIPKYFLWLFLISLIPIIQLITGIIFFAGDAIMACAYLVGFFLAMLVAGQLYDTYQDRLFIAIAVCFVTGATLSSFLALYQWLGLNSLGSWVADISLGGRPFANLGQPNNFALLECLGLVSLLYCWQCKVMGKYLAILLGILLFVGVVLSQSRTALGIAFVFICWWLWKHRVINLQLGTPALLVWMGLYAILLYSFPILNDLYMVPYEAGLNEKALGADLVRQSIWRQLNDALWRGSLWGYGWNQVSVAQVSVAAINPLSAYTEHSHNFFLDLLIWNGPVLGTIMIISICFWGLRRAYKCKSQASWYGLACIAFMLAHGMLEYPLEYAYFLFPLGLLVGGVTAIEGQPTKSVVIPRRVMAGCVFLVSILMIVIFNEYRIIEEDSRLMRFETARIGNLKAQQKAPDVVFLTQLREFNRFARTEARPNMSVEDLKWMERVAHRYAYSPALFRYSLALFLNNRPEQGRIELIRLSRLHGEPHYIDAINNLQLLSEKHPQLKELDLP